MNIPDGYTFERCDRYTPDEFLNRFTSRRNIVEKWMTEHPKDEYTEDDYIDAHHAVYPDCIGDARFNRDVVGGRTTKRYFPEPSDNR